jgi:metal-responsive CopG/Arc/MetJ family transcriptional regulator
MSNKSAPTRKKQSRITFDLDPKVTATVDKIAKQHAVNRSIVIRWAIREYIFLHQGTTDRTIPSKVQTADAAAD